MSQNTIEAKVTHHFAAAPEAVFDALTEPASVRLWQAEWLARGPGGEMVTCEIDAREGGSFLYVDRRAEGEARARGTFLAVERPTKLSFTWIADESAAEETSVVTVILEPAPDGNGSTATLYHEMDAQWADHREATERAWRTMLEAVDAVMRRPA